MRLRTRATTVLIALAALATPASCTQILGVEGDYTLGSTSASGGGTATSVGSGGSAGGLPDACADETQNGDETAVDCGGPLCPRCAIDLACETGSDCQSGLCEEAECACPLSSQPDATGACTCGKAEILCAAGCVSAPESTHGFAEIFPTGTIVGPSITTAENGTFGLSWVRSPSNAVVFATLAPTNQVEAAVTNNNADQSSSSLTAAVGSDFVLSTLQYSNLPGRLRTYQAGGGAVNNADNVIDLFDSDRIDCAKPSDVRCVFYHEDGTNGATVQSVRFDPAATASTPVVDLNEDSDGNASDRAFPAIATDGTVSLMVWLGPGEHSIRHSIDHGSSPDLDEDLPLGELGQVDGIDVATYSDAVWVVAWVESTAGAAPFTIGLATVDSTGGVISQTAIPLEDEALAISGPVSVAVATTSRTGSPIGVIAYAVTNPSNDLSELQLLYVELPDVRQLPDSPHRFVTIPGADGDDELESPALVFHPTTKLGVGLIHRSASEETAVLYRLPACDLFVPL